MPDLQANVYGRANRCRESECPRTSSADLLGLRVTQPPVPASPSVAFVTVSYGPDRDRCALLCRSIDRLATNTLGHWIIVDRADLPLFRSFESPFRRLLVTEEVVPTRLWRLGTRRIGLRSNVFLHPWGKPIRGWLLQQLAKLAVTRELEADVVVHTDSDVALVRQFESASLVDAAGRVRLFRAPEGIHAGLPGHVEWHRSAERLLGLPTAPLPLADYITSLVPWKRDNAAALLEYLEDRRGRWVRAVANAWNVSEYVLYGRFVDDVLGDDAGQFATSTSLCLDYWNVDPLSATEVDELIDAMGPDQVGVSITAKSGVPPSEYEAVLERRWSADRGPSS